MRKLSSIGLLCLLNLLLFPTRSNAQLVLAPQPYISSSGVTVGPVIVPTSSCGTPQITFVGATTYGFCGSLSGFFGVAVNGAERFRFTSSGTRYALDMGLGDIRYGSILGTSDIYLYRSAANTLRLDTDGAGGALTLVDVKGPLTTSSTIVSGSDITSGGSLAAVAGGNLTFISRSVFKSPADGIHQLLNNAQTGYTRLILGTNDATTNGLSIKNSTGVAAFRRGDDTADASMTAGSGTFSGTVAAGTYNITNLAFTTTAPTVTSAGTSPSVVANGTGSFRVNVGTGGTATTIVMAMPAATTGWNCRADNITGNAANRAGQQVVQQASTTTSVTVQNQTISTGAALAFTASDIVSFVCIAY